MFTPSTTPEELTETVRSQTFSSLAILAVYLFGSKAREKRNRRAIWIWPYSFSPARKKIFPSWNWRSPRIGKSQGYYLGSISNRCPYPTICGYEKIDHAIVFGVFQRNLSDFLDFAESISAFLIRSEGVHDHKS